MPLVVRGFMEVIEGAFQVYLNQIGVTRDVPGQHLVGVILLLKGNPYGRLMRRI